MDDTIPQDTPLKQCRGECKQFKPATTEFFNKKLDGLTAICKACRSIQRKQPEEAAKRRAYENRRYANKDKQLILEKNKRYRASHREALKAKKAAYNAAHREEAKQRSKAWHKAHLESAHQRNNLYNKAYVKAHPERSRIKRDNRRARLSSVTGIHTPQQIQEQLKRQKHKCYYCSIKFEKRNGNYVYHIDHTFPLSRVSNNIPANDISYLVIACPWCNTSKGNKYPWEWHEGGRLL